MAVTPILQISQKSSFLNKVYIKILKSKVLPVREKVTKIFIDDSNSFCAQGKLREKCAPFGSGRAPMISNYLSAFIIRSKKIISIYLETFASF